MTKSVRRALTPVSWKDVNIADAFWAPRLRVNHTATLPAVYEAMQRAGHIGAWRLDWKPGMPKMPHIFWDSDLAKWLEAVAYSMVIHPDPKLESMADEVIGLIAAAQQPDGYLNSHFIVVEPEKRWTNLGHDHELYCAGHLIEAAAAYFEATGKRKFLDLVCRYADCIDRTFGVEPGKKRGYCGHEEIELALVKLYRVTGEKRYLNLARYFIDERGRPPCYFDTEAIARGEDLANPARFLFNLQYAQAHKMVREQTEAVGHAVRAMYLYCAMADVAGETGDDGLLKACRTIWADVTRKKMYITGGLGQTNADEGFTTAYNLPNDGAYCETCGACGLVFWAHRMLQVDPNGEYADVMERALYNNLLSCVSADGRSFFYENKLATRGEYHRQAYYGCSC